VIKAGEYQCPPNAASGKINADWVISQIGMANQFEMDKSSCCYDTI